MGSSEIEESICLPQSATVMDYPSLALSFPSKILAINQPLVKLKEEKKKKNQNKDENRTALQEFGRDQLKLFPSS